MPQFKIVVMEKGFYRIKDINDGWYKAFYTIYSQSFPIHEQRTESQQVIALQQEIYHLDCLLENDTLKSFIAWWDFEEYIYIEHFAVNPDFRGQNIGSRMLKQLAELTGKVVLLEIDPLTDEVSRKRLHFYEKAGFRMNPYPHEHPAYREGYTSHQLLVLTYPETISPAQYQQFKNDLDFIVMNFKPSGLS